MANSLHVCIGAVFKWERLYRRGGLDALRSRKPPGRPARKRPAARRLIPMLLKRDPKAFGFLKGRWVVRDIAKALSAEGIKVSKSYVHDMLKGLGLTYKRPKLTVKSNDPNYYRKAKEVRNYKRAASALAKKGSWSHSRTRPGCLSIRRSRQNGWMERGYQRRVVTPGYNQRRNTFITLLWPKRRSNGFTFNTYAKRRSREFKRHLSDLIHYV